MPTEPKTAQDAIYEQACAMDNQDVPLDEWADSLIAALGRAGFELIRSKQAFTTGHCPEKAKPGGCQLHNLDCRYPECDRQPRTAEPEETTHDRLSRMGYRHEPSTTSQNGRDIVRVDGKRIGMMTCTEANEFCDLLDLQNTIGAIADPTDYETGGEKTVETCRRIASECMERNNL